jgi:protein-S-isoprenylcysteine O-methyltransferase Ste14
MITFPAATRIVLFAGLAILGFQLGSMIVRGRSANVAGSPTISPPLFYLAKIGMVVSCFCLIWRGLFRGGDASVLEAGSFLALFVPGCLLLGTAFHRLGTNLRMGLPGEETRLVTSGIYRISRNPIYLGLFLVMGASLIYAFSWLNLAAVSVSVVLHDRIARAEETFLASRFSDYATYKSRVRRYI